MINEIGEALARSSTSRPSSISSASESGRSSTRATIFIGIYDERRRRSASRTDRRAANASTAPSIPFGDGLSLARHSRSTGRSGIGAIASRASTARSRFGGTDESWLGVPILGGDRVIGLSRSRACVSDAFNDADERLLDHARLQHGRRARERAALRRDEAPAHRDRRSVPPSCAIINEFGEGLARQLDFDSDVRPGGRPDPGDLRARRSSRSPSTTSRRDDPLTVRRSRRASGSIARRWRSAPADLDRPRARAARFAVDTSVDARKRRLDLGGPVTDPGSASRSGPVDRDIGS